MTAQDGGESMEEFSYIVLDLEWNQPMSGQETITQPFHFDSEIIEIGALKLNNRFEEVLKVKPLPLTSLTSLAMTNACGSICRISSLMRHLQHIRRNILLQKLLFLLRGNIPRKQHLCITIAVAQHHRALVFLSCPGRSSCRI